MSNTTYRIYANGEVVHQDDFADHDSRQPYYDDYATVIVPDVVVNYIEDMVLGK